MSTSLVRKSRAPDHKPRRQSTRRPPARGKTDLRGDAASVGPLEGAAQRRAMIAEAAYYRAERRGFEPGYELEDWYGAERDIERALGADDDTPTRCG